MVNYIPYVIGSIHRNAFIHLESDFLCDNFARRRVSLRLLWVPVCLGTFMIGMDTFL